MIERIRRLGRTLYGWWMKFAHILGAINTRVLLTVMYIVVIGPTWLITKLLRKDFLNRKLGAASYWNPKEPVDNSIESLRRQF